MFDDDDDDDDGGGGGDTHIWLDDKFAECFDIKATENGRYFTLHTYKHATTVYAA